MADTTLTPVDAPFTETMYRLLSLLTDKERDIVERRFSLNNHPKETLDAIGQTYHITRERVRQIESVALRKLTRVSMDPSMQRIHELAYQITMENGGAVLEKHLVSGMLQHLPDGKTLDKRALILALQVSNKIERHERSKGLFTFWRVRQMSANQIYTLIDSAINVLEQRNNEPISLEDLHALLDDTENPLLLESCLHISKDIIFIDGGFALRSNRMINPRSIKDKIYVSLKKIGKPLHFTDIIDSVLTGFPEQKPVTPQAIHNELIRHNIFVLVGRGKYGLTEWDMTAGTVCDVIIQVMQESGKPMKRQDIINKVLEKRDIRVGTISLNLQKYEFFERVGRAVYVYDEGKDYRRRHQKRRTRSKKLAKK